jgi:hypothetical protein
VFFFRGVMMEEPSRRGGRPKGRGRGGRHHQREQATRSAASVAAEDDDDMEEDGKGWVTRCPCGRNDDDDGEFMIQCDKCSVWQHGNCVRIAKDSVPEKYECDQCNPVQYQERLAALRQGIKASTRGVKRKKHHTRPGAAVPLLPGSSSSGSGTVANTMTVGASASSASNSSSVVGIGGVGGRRASDADLMDPASKRQKVVPFDPRQSARVAEPMASPEDGDVNMDDDGTAGKMSREDRKLQQYLAMFNKLEGGTHTGIEKKRKSSQGGIGTPPDLLTASPGRGRGLSGLGGRRRRNSRAASFSNEELLDLDVLKSSPEILKQVYPMAPMYLGRKNWMIHTMNKLNATNISSTNASSANPSASSAFNTASAGVSTAKQVILPRQQEQAPGFWSVKKRMLAGNFT